FLFQSYISCCLTCYLLRSWHPSGRAGRGGPVVLRGGAGGSGAPPRVAFGAAWVAACGLRSAGCACALLGGVRRSRRARAAILRTAVFELLDGVPVPVAINEAVEAAENLSTDASGRFVNGVLGAVARELEARETAP